MTSEPAEEAILEDVRADLADYQRRVGLFAFKVTEATLGRRIVDAYYRDGVVREHEHMPVTLVEHRDWAHQTYGRPWFTAGVDVAEDGTCGFSFDYERPPRAPELRTVGNIADDLDMHPRPAALVPGWMKVELALVGAWDLVSDQLTVNDRWEPVGIPQTAASVGVPLPAGAEHAWSEEVFGGAGRS